MCHEVDWWDRTTAETLTKPNLRVRSVGGESVVWNEVLNVYGIPYEKKRYTVHCTTVQVCAVLVETNEGDVVGRPPMRAPSVLTAQDVTRGN